MNAQAEASVKKLSRLPANQICANCGTTQRHGFNTVCIKYLTFVCNLCKTAHQAVSHRCKSLTMSSWDAGEVLKLKKHGNDYAKRVWLAGAPGVGEGGRPREGDHVDVFKRFVVVAYDQKRYYREPTGGDDVSSGVGSVEEVPVVARSQPAVRSNVAEERRRKKKVQSTRTTVVSTPALAPVPMEPAVDLLDFGAMEISNPSSAPTLSAVSATQGFADFSQVAAAPTPISAASTAKPPVTHDFGDFSQAISAAPQPVTQDFGDFAQAVPTDPQPVAQDFGDFSQAMSTAPSPVTQDFGDFSQAASTDPPPTAFDPFGDSAAATTMLTPSLTSSQPLSVPATNNSTNDTSFDPFDNLSGTKTSVTNSNMMQAQPSQLRKLEQSTNNIMNCNINIMPGVNNSANSSSMISNMGMNTGVVGNNTGMMNNGMTKSRNNRMINNGMMNNGMVNNGMMMSNVMMTNKAMMMNGMMMNHQHGNNGMLRSGGSTPQQQQIMEMRQQPSNNFGGMVGFQQNMNGCGISSSSTDGKRDPFKF